MPSFHLTQQSTSNSIFQLGKLRQVYQLIAILLVIFAEFVMPSPVSIVPVISITFGYIIFSWCISRYAKIQYENDTGMLLVTLVDLSTFGVLVYYTGGASNGMITVLLMPVAVAAASLSMFSASLLAAYASTIYSILTWQFISSSSSMNDHVMMHDTSVFSSHILAMWVAFVMSCIIVVWFVGRQSQLVREKQKSLAKLREQQLRDEQLVSIATFAANAAHDLATPLTSIRLINEELIDECDEKESLPNSTNSEIYHLLHTQQEQLARCQNILTGLSLKALNTKSDHHDTENAQKYLQQLIQRWLVSRPEISVKQELQLGDFSLITDASLDAAITNILDNGADASLQNDQVQLYIVAEPVGNMLELTVQDYGEGIADELLERIGKEPVPSVKAGLGLGQFLANASIERVGGHVWRTNNEHGCLTKIILPLY